MITQSIKRLMDLNYNIDVRKIELFREGGNLSYIVYGVVKAFFAKIIRTPFLETALHSIEVQIYLMRKQFPVIPIIFTKTGSSCVHYTENNIDYLIILFEYIPGDEPSPRDTEKAGELVGRLHQTMKSYSGSLSVKGKEFFIDRYVNIMEEVNYKKTDWFREYGNELWEKVKNLPQGYCHCDLYRGNINKAMNNKMYVIDFDTSCIAFSLYDVALFCNDTDYFNFDIYGYERTANRLAEFYVGYQKYYSLSQEELSAIYSLIAIYHFQLQATMIELYGLNENQIRFFDSQYKWLQQWEEQCGDSKRQE